MTYVDEWHPVQADVGSQMESRREGWIYPCIDRRQRREAGPKWRGFPGLSTEDTFTRVGDCYW